MKTQFKGQIDMGEGSILSVNLNVLLYEEDGIYYAMCPALDVIGYGCSVEEAKDSFRVMINEILSDAIANGTLFVLLESYGWIKTQPPKITELIDRVEGLADMLNNKAYNSYLEQINIPCA